MSNYASTRSGSTENITIYTESTNIPTSHSTFVTEYFLETTIQAMFDLSK